MTKIILASASPRRKELMALLPWSYEVQTQEVDETIDSNLSLEKNVKALALKKALAVASTNPDCIIIGADTMVCIDDQLLGKPKDDKEATKMLMKLSGRKHQVLSGVAIIWKDQNVQCTFCEKTDVKMQMLKQDEIMDYIKTKEGIDKAGSYAIQGYGARYIEGIEGDYFNVVGLPVHKVYSHLKELVDRSY